MKIATWNLNWPRTASKIEAINDELEKVDADVLILTETNDVIRPGAEYRHLSSDPLPAPRPYAYKSGDHEATIWSKYAITQIAIKERFTSVCVQLPLEKMIVYGTVIGILGIKKSFSSDLRNQINDWEVIGATERNICIAGDFNVCWNGEKFPKVGRDEIAKCFDRLSIENLTREIEGNIDHIAISKSYVKTAECKWNLDKKLSDHIGVSVNIRLAKSIV